MAQFSKINKTTTATRTPRNAGTSVLGTKKSNKVAVSHEGGIGFEPKAKTELFLLGASFFAGSDTFYEASDDRDARLRALVAKVAVKDFDWVARFAKFLRTELNLRSVAVMVAAEAAMVTRNASATITVRQMVDSVCLRADEPAEFIAYWATRTGATRDAAVKMPKGVKRGLADAVQRLYTERNALKYDSTARSVRMGDVIELVHPSAKADWQGALYSYLLDQRHHGDARSLEQLPMISARAQLMALPQEQRRGVSNERLAAAGMTWEALSGWLNGPMDAAAWESVIDEMGVFALVRNLRNFDQADISKAAAKRVIEKISDPETIAKSRLLPFRFYSAYVTAPALRWGGALEEALDASLANVPVFDESTLVLIDSSGSMGNAVSEKSRVTAAEQAAIFGLSLARRSPKVDVAMFATTSARFVFAKGASVLSEVKRMQGESGRVGHGTNIASAIRDQFEPGKHERVVLLSDEAAFYDTTGVDRSLPAEVPLHTFNLVGYRSRIAPSGPNRYTYGGASDSTFKLMKLVEQGEHADWDVIFRSTV